MGCPKLEDNSIEEELTPEVLELIDHIGAILAEEYVQLLKEDKEKNGDESSDICKVLK